MSLQARKERAAAELMDDGSSCKKERTEVCVGLGVKMAGLCSRGLFRFHLLSVDNCSKNDNFAQIASK